MSIVAIVLPTYNGEKYVGQQIKSILSQTFQSWHLYIRDDGSHDNTVNIIETFQQRYSDKITVITDQKRNLRVAANVFEILKYTKEKYIMFADQDDVWFRKKVEIQLMEIKKLEKRYHNKPLLVCSDAVVTDQNLNILYKSFFKCAYYNSECCNFSNLIQRNIIQGASTIVNRRLIDELDLAMKDGNTKLILHDYWLSLVASSMGKIKIIDKPLMYYRQHNNNLVGALNYRKNISIVNVSKVLTSVFYTSADQQIVKEFKKVYQKKLSEEQIKLLNGYLVTQDFRKHYIFDRWYVYDPVYIRIAKLIIGVHHR